MADDREFCLALRLLLEHEIDQAVGCVERCVHTVGIVRDWLQVERLDADALLLRVLLRRLERQLVALDLLEERGHRVGDRSILSRPRSIRCWSAARNSGTVRCEWRAVNATAARPNPAQSGHALN